MLFCPAGALKPTLCIGVPRVFDRIYTGVLGKVQEAGGLKKFLFDWGYKRKSHFLKQGFPHDKVREDVLCSGS